MALVAEDGTGKSNAESYASVAQLDAFAAKVGSPASWTAASTPRKEAALRRATWWLDARYAAAWIGYRGSSTQALEWPRDGAVTEDVGQDYSNMVPSPLSDLTCQAALYDLDAELGAPEDRGGEIESVGLGPLSVTYAPGAPAERSFELLGAMVRRLVVPWAVSGVRRLVRG